MSQANIIREEIEENCKVFSGVLIEMKNAYLVFLSEGEENLGTLAVSLPQKPGIIGPSISSTLLGERSAMLARLLAERLTKNLKKMVLVSVFVKTVDEKVAGHILIRLLDKILNKKTADEGE